MGPHRQCVCSQMRCPVGLINGPECVLIGIQRYLCVDHEALPARNADDDVGPQPPAIFDTDAHFGLEIGVFGQATAFEDVLQLLLAPAPARLGGIAECIDQFRRLARHALGADTHRLDLALEVAKRIAALGLDLGNTLLIALQAFCDGLEQSLQPLPRRFFGLFEPCIGTFEELALGGVE